MSLSSIDERLRDAPEPLLVQLVTAHGTVVVARRRDGAVCQAAAANEAEFVELVAYVPHTQGDVCFLTTRTDPPLDLRLDGEGPPSSVLSYRMATGETAGSYTFRHPSSGRFLSADPPSDEPGAGLSASRESAGGWEQFEFVQAAGGPAPASLAGLMRMEVVQHALTDPDFLLGLARSTHPETALGATAAFARLVPRDLLRRQVPALAKLPIYPRLFAALRDYFAHQRSAFSYNSIAQMQWGIEQYGWKIGEHTYGAPEVIDAAYGTLTIGKYCSIAGQVQIILGNHARSLTTTYPFAALREWWPGALDEHDDHDRGEVEIGHAVWLGAHACVLPGARIGHGCIIGAHAVARGTIPPFSVYVGNPGRVVRRLYDDHTIERLLAVAWWDWPDEKVDRFIPLLIGPDINAFLEAAEPSFMPKVTTVAAVASLPKPPPAPPPRRTLIGRLNPFG